MSLDREEWERVDTGYEGGIADHPRDAAVEQRLVRLFRALHDGAAPRSRRRRSPRIRRSTTARSARRSTGRRSIISGSARAAAGLALRPPASRRDDGRMVDGRRAREAARRRPTRSRAGCAQKATFHIVPNMNPGRLAARPSAHQRGRHQPQPRMARAERRAQPRSALRPQRDGRDRRRFRDGRPWRRGDRRQLPRRLRGHSELERGSRAPVRRASATRSGGISPDFQTEKGYEIPEPGKANMSMSTAQLAERFGAVSMTLEMPFKDNADLPDPRLRLVARAQPQSWPAPASPRCTRSSPSSRSAGRPASADAHASS